MAAGLIFKTKFVSAGSAGFGRYLNYIDRPEAVQLDRLKEFDVFKTYTEYMGNPEKSTGLFTAEKDRLNTEEKQTIKELFSEAQGRGSLLHQSLFSFESEWLKENGLMDQSGTIAEAPLREYTRKAVQTLMKEEQMQNWKWTAAIHRNTKHVHIHIAMVEPFPSWTEGVGRCRRNPNTGELYQRGKFQAGSLRKTKATFVNLAIGSQKEQARMNELLRQRILAGKQSMPFSEQKGSAMEASFLRLLKGLPEDMRLWNYNMSAMEPYREEINELSRLFLESYFPEEFQEYLQIASKPSEKYARSYGGTEWSDQFEAGKVQDLYARMGNVILAECRQVRWKERQMEAYPDALNFPSDRKQWQESRKTRYRSHVFQRTCFFLSRIFQRDLQSMKNQVAYERLRQEEEWRRKNSL